MKFAFPKVLAWELTRRCPFACRHCRASASDAGSEGDLSTAECFKVIDSLTADGNTPPMVIWTGGEPMAREDLVELVRYASAKGVRGVLAPCGALVTPERLSLLKEAGISACSFSLDGADRMTHDSFRGTEGAWDAVRAAIGVARDLGMPFQVNTVVRRGILGDLDAVYADAMTLGAVRLDLFFLVPTGRASSLAPERLDDTQIASVIEWARGKRVKLTCCPQAGSCIGGRGFAFLSHAGELRTCGFNPVGCGNVRDHGFDLQSAVAAADNPLGAAGDCRSVTGECGK